MIFNKAAKEKIFEEFGHQKTCQDTGSTESQVALFTHRIKFLTEHLGTHKKDKASRAGLLKLVGKRKRLLSYLQREDLVRYRALLASLGLRK
jgi:small subunit ribosomal protein S15